MKDKFFIWAADAWVKLGEQVFPPLIRRKMKDRIVVCHSGEEVLDFAWNELGLIGHLFCHSAGFGAWLFDQASDEAQKEYFATR